MLPGSAPTAYGIQVALSQTAESPASNHGFARQTRILVFEARAAHVLGCHGWPANCNPAVS